MRSSVLLIVAMPVAATATPAYVDAPGATLTVEFTERVDETTSRNIIDWIDHVADQVSMPYGRFPIAEPRILVIPSKGNPWGDDSPVPFGRVTRRGGETVELYVNVDRPIEDM